MYKLLFFVGLALISFSTHAQQAVGIGTPAPNASAMLDVVSNNKGLLIPRMENKASITSPAEGLIVYETGTSLFYQYDGKFWRKMLNSTFWNNSDTKPYIFNTTDSIGIGTTLPLEKLHVNNGNFRLSGDIKMSGFAGIGTTFPEQQLHVRSSAASEGILLEAVNPILQLRQSNTPLPGYENMGFIQLSGPDIRMGTNSSNNAGKLVIRTNGNDRMWVDSAGNVSIGSGYKVANGYKFSVNGKIMAEEVRVQLDGDWPDYVFAADYKPMPLNELQAFIKKNKHLPGILPATEMKTNGLALGDTQKRMMEKIEELTLYILELKQEIEQLKSQYKLP